MMQTSQLSTRAAVQAEERELRRVARASARGEHRREIESLLAAGGEEAALASLTPSASKKGNRKTAAAKHKATQRKTQARQFLGKAASALKRKGKAKKVAAPAPPLGLEDKGPLLLAAQAALQDAAASQSGLALAVVTAQQEKEALELNSQSLQDQLFASKKEAQKAKRQCALAKKRARSAEELLAAASEAGASKKRALSAEDLPAAAKEEDLAAAAQEEDLPAAAVEEDLAAASQVEDLPGEALEKDLAASLALLMEEDFAAEAASSASEPEPPLPPPEADPLKEGDRVRVCSWLAKRNVLGKEGRVVWATAAQCQALVEVKQGTVLPILLPASYFRQVDPAWLEHKALRQSTHLEPDLALTLSGLCSKTWDKEPAELQLKAELDLNQMDAGLLYLVWSLAPDRTVVLPSVNLATVKVFSGQEEELVQQVRLTNTCRKARLVLLPINEGGHWTLLVLEQTWPTASASATEPAVPGPEASTPSQAGHQHCSKCLGAGCKDCDFPKAQKYVQRKQEEQQVFSPAHWPHLPGGSWSARYYDPLPKESHFSRLQAERVLAYFAALGWPQELPPTEEGLRQKDC
eukprot:8831573-Lingulodinium_polyedra.AAC.1